MTNFSQTNLSKVIEELIEIKGIGESIATVILNSKDLSSAKEIFSKCKKLNVKIVTIKDKLYPDYAKNTFKAPILLYYRGTLIENSIGVSIPPLPPLDKVIEVVKVLNKKAKLLSFSPFIALVITSSPIPI